MRKLLLCAMGCVAFAAQAQEVGRVISSVPVVQQVAVPRQVCSQQQVVQPQSSGGGALVGAIVGGLLGNTIGHGGGRAAATGLGIVAGAAVGNSVEAQGNPPYVAQHCTTQTYYENRAVGYNVTYEYAGKQYTVQMPYDPGPTIQLQITPMGGQTPPPSGQPLVTAPPVVESNIEYLPPAPVVVTQPLHTVVYPSYTYAARPYPYYYPPVGLSLNLGYVHHRHHRHHGHHRH